MRPIWPLVLFLSLTVSSWAQIVTDPGAGAGGGVTDHGALTGLADNDHVGYLQTSGSNTVGAAQALWAAADMVCAEGGTADDFETCIDFQDPSADITINVPLLSGAFFVTTLTSNPNAANTVWGIAGGFAFEGFAVDGFETTLTVTNPTADRAIILADVAGTVTLNDSTPIANDFARFTGTDVLEGRSAAETLSDIAAESATSNDFDPDRLLGDATDDNKVDQDILEGFGASADPKLILRDSDAADGDDNYVLDIDATDTGSGTEDIDITETVQVAGVATNVMVVSASGGTMTLGSAGLAPVLADGAIATTQTAADNSTKVATTAYADAAGGSGFDPETSVRMYTDFTFCHGSGATADSFDFSDRGNGAGNTITLSPGDVTNAHPGVCAAEMGTTATGYATIVSRGIMVGAGATTIKGVFKTEANLSDGTDGYQLVAGIMDDAAVANSDGCWLRYEDSVNTGKFEYVCANTLTETTSDSAVTVVASTWYKWEITFNSGNTSVNFLIDNANSADITTNLPATTNEMQLVMGGYKTSGTTNREVGLDMMYYQKDVTR